ncbi:MAG: hypothetical protein EPN47_16285 [Acidobacteria bacterium]|nr:MAG: hypothetical protein EPN47_16285 [Acidobacteriota bacterium]
MKALHRLMDGFTTNSVGVCKAESQIPIRVAGAMLFCLMLGANLFAKSSPLLPGQYFRLMVSGVAQVQEHMSQHPGADLPSLEDESGWKHLPYSILAPAVLYSKRDPANQHFHDPKMLAEAIKLGDYFAGQNEKGIFTPRLDSDWDTYMWLEAYRLLQPELGAERSARWKKAILENAAPFYDSALKMVDFPWYNTPYIGTSPNHYAQWASLLMLSGRVFGKPDWRDLGNKILHRYSTVEQTPDGYWGEFSRMGPTTGYDYITLTQVALYWEYSRDPAALKALRRSTDFHKYFTYLDGTPVEVVNNRNRYWTVPAWGQFGFSNFPDGRRYDEFLVDFFRPGHLTMDELGRLSQDALYYHAGPTAPIPQDMESFSHRLSIPAGIRKTGPWEVGFSGIVEPPAIDNQFYIDRQSNVSVFNQKLGLIISGANSKRQPELATFMERFGGNTNAMPVSSRLQMGNGSDRLSLAYNKFFVDLYVPSPAANSVTLRFEITGKGTPPDEAELNLQLVLKSGQVLETGAGKKFTLGSDRVDLGPDDLGGWIRQGNWTLKVDPAARLQWPIYPYNPYANAPEKTLEHAVGRLTIPLDLKSQHGFIRPHQQEILFTLSTNGK